ncbi:MAG: hypothetical protein LBR24_04370, partial [Methanobrevibacter sp.]|nr:hypothetical protein [Methanobrevibacter sp.]
NKLIKRGFYKEYLEKSEDTSNIRGKINLNSSIKRRTIIYKKLNIIYDEFSEDVLFNQIIKATLRKLTRVDLEEENKKKIKKLNIFFNNISDIELNKIHFDQIRWDRNNQHYKLIITICELIYKNKLPDESKPGYVTFKDFIKNKEEMYELFEAFVLNFFKKECKELTVGSPTIKWNVETLSDKNHKNYIPFMVTDIVLENKYKQLIIDTKFYQKILTRFKSNHKRISSENLYQITSYVTHSPFKGTKEGMLLYAGTITDKEEIDFKYKIGEHIYYIKTLKLNQEWENIDKDLKEIADLLNKENKSPQNDKRESNHRQ